MLSTDIFSIDVLEKLGKLHKELIINLEKSLNTFETNRDIYLFIDKYIKNNNLTKAFPIGISINQIIAHDSFHELNLKILKPGDFIKIDVGFIESGNIIDCARTFVYKCEQNLIPTCIKDCESIALGVEDFIRKQIKLEKKISIQKISAMTNALIIAKGYSALDFLGGHTIEFGKVHGKQLILNKPLNLLPKEAANFIDSEATIGPGEMFAIEIYLGEKKAEGNMIKSASIPVTHYQLNDKNDDLIKIKSKLNNKEKEIFNKLVEKTNNLAYEYIIHKEFDNKIIKKLIDIGLIIKHDALEFKSTNNNELIKYIQYEDCFIITDDFQLINLSK